MPNSCRSVFLSFFIFVCQSVSAHQADLTQYVRPLSGTAYSTTVSALKHDTFLANFANTIPSVCTPFAMPQWTPKAQATENKCILPYYYKDALFGGFRGSHCISGSCTQDYGSVTIMPNSGKLKTTRYAAKFTHNDERSSAYEYQVNLSKYNLTADITARPRCAVMQITANAADRFSL